MSNLNYPKILIQIEGKGKIKDLYNIEYFNPKSIEWSDEINIDSGFIKVFDKQMISSPIRKIIIESPYYNPQTDLEYLTIVKYTTLDQISGLPIESVKHIEGIIIENYPASFGLTIQTIDIQITSTQLKPISVKIYCWEDLI